MSGPVSSVVRWVQNQSRGGKSAGGTSLYGNKSWVHPPDALNFGRVDYTVKFLGEVEASAPKGTQVVKEAVHKIRFNLQIRRAQGYKLPKVELQINTEGLNIVDPKSRAILYRYPLHRISFCADDKQDRRVFAFIAKQPDSAVHNVFVFLSDKAAEEITLTIGEAFDLAYRRFVDGKGKDLEAKKMSILLRKRIVDLEAENVQLKARLAQYETNPTPNVIEPKSTATVSTAARQLPSNGHSAIPQPPRQPLPPVPVGVGPQHHHHQRNANGVGTNSDLLGVISSSGPDVGRRLENLQIDRLEDLFDDNFDPRANEQFLRTPNTSNSHLRDAFGLEPFGTPLPSANGNSPKTPTAADGADPTQQDLMAAISLIDSRLAEMRDGFASGLSFGDENFELNDVEAETNGTVVTAKTEGKF